MTKKDYQLIASVINSSMKDSKEIDTEKFMKKLSERLVQDNPRFNDVKFTEACLKNL